MSDLILLEIFEMRPLWCVEICRMISIPFFLGKLGKHGQKAGPAPGIGDLGDCLGRQMCRELIKIYETSEMKPNMLRNETEKGGGAGLIVRAH